MKLKLYRVVQEDNQDEEIGAYGKGIYLLWNKSDALMMASREGKWCVQTCHIKLDDLNGVNLMEPGAWLSYARCYLEQERVKMSALEQRVLQAKKYDWCIGPVIDDNLRPVIDAYNEGNLSVDEFKEMYLSFSLGFNVVLMSEAAKQRYKPGRRVRLSKRRKRTWSSMRQTVQELAVQKLNELLNERSVKLCQMEIGYHV